MTAEVAVMNKLAVALAADSAITIGQEEGPKIYNTSNKLFSLSKYFPVGIMIFGNAEFMGVPWETIIKYYRGKLGKQHFDSLQDYAQHLISFLERENIVLCTPESQELYVQRIVNYYLNMLVSEINKKVDSIITEKVPITEQDVAEVVTKVVKSY